MFSGVPKLWSDPFAAGVLWSVYTQRLLRLSYQRRFQVAQYPDVGAGLCSVSPSPAPFSTIAGVGNACGRASFAIASGFTCATAARTGAAPETAATLGTPAEGIDTTAVTTTPSANRLPMASSNIAREYRLKFRRRALVLLWFPRPRELCVFRPARSIVSLDETPFCLAG